jgi:hypothetical protein
MKGLLYSSNPRGAAHRRNKATSTKKSMIPEKLLVPSDLVKANRHSPLTRATAIPLIPKPRKSEAMYLSGRTPAKAVALT